jgi:D-alanine--poly(phosphoribitol) ligase subunit 1
VSELSSRLIEAFSAYQDRPALELDDVVLTYAELEGAAWAFARQLDENAADGSRIGVLAQRTVAAYVAVLGSILSGRPYVPINPKFPVERQKSIAAAADCAAYVFDEKSRGMAEALAHEFGGCALTPDVEQRDQRGVSRKGRHAYVMFTSGTTGTPKGVAVRYDNVASYVDAFAKIAPVGATDRCTQLFDLSFDLSVHDMMVSWTSGACLCVPGEGELIDPVGFAARKNVTCWFSVPSVVSMAKRMRQLSVARLPELRLSLFCGEALPTSIAESWSEAAPNSDVWNLYGPTEATIAITAFHFRAKDAPGMGITVPLGDPYDHCAVAAVDDNGNAVAPGASGELLLAGAQITDGYVNNPEEQRTKFIELAVPGQDFRTWYRSGDLVRRDPQWGLVYEGRVDDQVKIVGYRVELLEIEEALRKAAQCPDVAVVPWPLSDEGSASGLVAFVADGRADQRDIIARCRGILASYMVPKRVINVDALPRNANGKIDRRALRFKYLERGDSAAVSAEPGAGSGRSGLPPSPEA